MRPGRCHCLRETMKKRFITPLTCLLGLIISSSPSPQGRAETASIGPVYLSTLHPPSEDSPIEKEQQLSLMKIEVQKLKENESHAGVMGFRKAAFTVLTLLNHCSVSCWTTDAWFSFSSRSSTPE